MRKHRFTAWLLTLAMALSLGIPAAAYESPLGNSPEGPDGNRLLIAPAPVQQEWLVPQVKDYDGRLTDAADAWCSDAIVTCYESGLMEGRTATKFDAASNLTYAQITVITARLYDLLNGGDGKLPPAAEGEAWYQPAVNLLKEASDDEMLQLLLKKLDREDDRPNTPCARRDFVWMLSAVLPENALTPINDVTVIPDEAHNRADFLPFYQAGILGGSDAYGTFNGESPLTRGAAAAILARLVDLAQRLTFTLKSFDLCQNVLGVEPDAVLLTIEGKEISAELFANQLCTSLRQWGRQNTARAQSAAVTHFCEAYGISVLAAEKSVILTEEEQAEAIAKGQAYAGFLGTTAAYQQFRYENVLLNSRLKDQYCDVDWKNGEGTYHNDLAKRTETLKAAAAPAEALEALNLTAVYDQLMKSPYSNWNR